MGLDKSIPYAQVYMVCNTPETAPRAAQLPDGYQFAWYSENMESQWARILWKTDMASSVEKGLDCFAEFRENLPLCKERMLFVMDANGVAVGTATLWEGELGGKPMARVHWVGVLPEHEGKGIAKALLSRLFQRYDEIGLDRPVYLVTQTWSYPAIHIYYRYGFRPYGVEDAPGAWCLVFDKLGMKG